MEIQTPHVGSTDLTVVGGGEWSLITTQQDESPRSLLSSLMPSWQEGLGGGLMAAFAGMSGSGTTVFFP